MCHFCTFRVTLYAPQIVREIDLRDALGGSDFVPKSGFTTKLENVIR